MSLTGIRRGLSTLNNVVNALRLLKEGVRGRRPANFTIIIDFKKALDSVHRDKLFEIL